MPDNTSARSAVLVTGSGRSGTSSLAGSLKRLGLWVPQPEVPAKPSNPKGFYEPQWVIDFHKGHLKALHMHNIDSRPDAVRLVEERLADGAAEAELRQWLAEQAVHPQIVVKDPHAFWFTSIWRKSAADLGVELKLLTALRHPAEVVGSRDLAYLQNQPEEVRLTKETSNVAGWVHAALLTERAGRGTARAFVRYTDLMADWREALGTVQEQLQLDFNADLRDRAPHEVDDFLDADLRKSRLTWDDVTVPARLRDMAEEVWNLLARLIEDPQDAGSQERLDQLHEEYVAMYAAAVATVYDHTKAEVVAIQQESEARIADLQKRLRHQRRLVKQLNEGREEPAGGPARRLLKRIQGR